MNQLNELMQIDTLEMDAIQKCLHQGCPEVGLFWVDRLLGAILKLKLNSAVKAEYSKWIQRTWELMLVEFDR